MRLAIVYKDCSSAEERNRAYASYILEQRARARRCTGHALLQAVPVVLGKTQWSGRQ